MVGGRLGQQAIPRPCVHDPDECPRQGQAEGHRVGRRDPVRHADAPPDDHNDHGQPEQEDLEQSEPAEGRSSRCGRGDGGLSTHLELHLVAHGHRI